MNTKTFPATVTLGNRNLSITEVLHRLHQRGGLLPLLLESASEELLQQQARALGLSISSEELQQAADVFRRRHGLTSAELTSAWLARRQLLVQDFEDVLERDLLLAKLKDHLTRDRIADHFAAHRDRYAQAQLRQIVVATESAARELLTQLEEGAEFAELARTHSLHPASRSNGGSLGILSRAALPPALAAVIFSTGVGAVAGPCATAEGFHLFLVEALVPAILDDPTAAHIRQELFDAWLTEQLPKVQIDLSWLES